MDPIQTGAFTLAAVALLGSPGPGIAALVAIGRANGVRGGLGFYAALQLGLALAAAASAAGLASALQAAPAIQIILAAAATIYLLWLAWSIATAPVGTSSDYAKTSSLTGASAFLLGIANPKAYLAFASLFGSFTVIEAGGVGDSATKVGAVRRCDAHRGFGLARAWGTSRSPASSTPRRARNECIDGHSYCSCSPAGSHVTQCGPTRDAARGELWLFSYGTLQQPEVQQALFGRALISSPDVLPGFVVTTVAITDPEVVALSGSSEHPMLYWSGNDTDEVRGSALAVTEHDLVQADAYESTDYVRTTATLRSGRVAFVYLARHARLCSRPRATYRPARP